MVFSPTPPRKAICFSITVPLLDNLLFEAIGALSPEGGKKITCRGKPPCSVILAPWMFVSFLAWYPLISIICAQQRQGVKGGSKHINKSPVDRNPLGMVLVQHVNTLVQNLSKVNASLPQERIN